MHPARMFAVAAGAAAALLAAGLFLPSWLLFLTTMAASRGLAVLGIVSRKVSQRGKT